MGSESRDVTMIVLGGGVEPSLWTHGGEVASKYQHRRASQSFAIGPLTLCSSAECHRLFGAPDVIF